MGEWLSPRGLAQVNNTDLTMIVIMIMMVVVVLVIVVVVVVITAHWIHHYKLFNPYNLQCCQNYQHSCQISRLSIEHIIIVRKLVVKGVDV